MADVGNIKPPGPIWPQPTVEKTKRKEDQAEQERKKYRDGSSRKGDEEDDSDGGIDEYA